MHAADEGNIRKMFPLLALSQNIFQSILRYINHYRNNIYSGSRKINVSEPRECWKISHAFCEMFKTICEIFTFECREIWMFRFFSPPNAIQKFIFRDIFLCVNQKVEISFLFLQLRAQLNINLKNSYYFSVKSCQITFDLNFDFSGEAISVHVLCCCDENVKTKGKKNI